MSNFKNNNVSKYLFDDIISSSKQPTTIEIMYYEGEKLEKKVITQVEELEELDVNKGYWFDISGFENIEVLKELCQYYHIHPLLLEDIINANHRPKLEYDDGYLLLLQKLFSYSSEEKEITVKQISFILLKNVLITCHDDPIEVIENVKNTMEKSKRIRSQGTDFLFYILVDTVVDSYFATFESIDDDLDNIEDKLISNPDAELLHEIYEIKREMVKVRNSIWPTQSMVSSLAKMEHDLLTDTTLYYFRDVQDHLIQLLDITETFRDILSGMLDLYLSSIGNKTNDTMKVLTVFSTIFIPITYLTSLYGTNFHNIPFLDHEYAYFVFVFANLLITFVTYRILKKKNWF